MAKRKSSKKQLSAKTPTHELGLDLLAKTTAIEKIKDPAWAQKLYAVLCSFGFKHDDNATLQVLNWQDARLVIKSLRSAAGVPEPPVMSWSLRKPIDPFAYWYLIGKEHNMFPEVLDVLKEAGWTVV